MKYLIPFTLLFTLNLSAQVKPEINSLLQSIKSELQSNHDRRTLLQVKNQLERTLATLSGSSNGGGIPGPRPGRNIISCVARDNDGRAPWMLGAKDPVTLRTTKLPSSNLGSLEVCGRSKEVAISIRASVFACISRDNDGRAPYALAHYRENKLVKKVNNMGSFENCLTSLANAARSHAAIAFCASRDNDGRAPWIEMSVVAQSGQVHRAGSYSSLDQCLNSNNSLNSGLNVLLEISK